MKRIALLGGSFDPIHNGHLMLAEYAKVELKLDDVIFVPCYESAYNDKIIQAYPNDRLAMLHVALPENFEINTYELRKTSPSYTINTIKYFIEMFNGIYKVDGYELLFIAGTDTRRTFNSWKSSEEIERLVDVKFAGYDFYVPQIGINSTLIRHLVEEGKSIKYLVPEGVADYIIKNNLYK